jgi:hypothetical protein
MTLAVIDFLAFLLFATDPILLRAMARRLRGETDTSFATGPSSGPQHTGVAVHITTTGPVHDEEWRDKSSLTTPSIPTFADRVPVVITKGDADGYSLEDGERDKVELSYPPRK